MIKQNFKNSVIRAGLWRCMIHVQRSLQLEDLWHVYNYESKVEYSENFEYFSIQ